MFIAGEPAVFWGKGDQGWRELLRVSGLAGVDTLSLRFVVNSFRRRGNWFDLDNLVVPVLSVVGARTLKSVWATVETGGIPGVHLGHDFPPPPPEARLRYALQRPPVGSVHSAAALAEFAEAVVLGTDEPLGCEIVLGRAVGPFVWGEFRGPVKPIIDSLWPLVGGTAGKQADHRIRDLWRPGRLPPPAGRASPRTSRPSASCSAA